MRSRLCRSCKEFHDTDQPWPAACASHFGITADASGPQIISDTIEPFQAMHTGEVFSSKSAYRRDLKARGYIEVGNERVSARPTPRPPVRETLRQTMRQLGG